MLVAADRDTYRGRVDCTAAAVEILGPLGVAEHLLALDRQRHALARPV